MDKYKSMFDIIYLSDKELGFDTGHDGDRPCIIVGIDNMTNEGYVVPLSSRFNPADPNRMQHRLAFGSYIDLSNSPIRINENQLQWSEKSDKYIDGDDVEVLEERYYKWMNMGEEDDF